MRNFQKFIDISRALLDWREHDLRTFNCSFLVRRNKILSIGINRDKTHPINRRNPKFGDEGQDISCTKLTCAELVAINRSKNQKNIDYPKTKMINIRIKRDGSLGLGRPCESCQSLLNYFGIKEVYYSLDNQGIEKFSK